MAQWQELLKLDSALQGKVSQLYDGKFPREIRHYLSVLIESLDWDSAAGDEFKARACFNALLAHLDEQWKRSIEENNILQGPDFPGIGNYLMENFGDEPLKLAVMVSECLKEEKKILISASEAQGCNHPAEEHNWRDLDNKVEELRQKISELKKEIKSLEGLNESLEFVQKTWKNQTEQRVGLDASRALVEDECLKQAKFITETKQMVLQQIVNILNLAKQIVETLTAVELPEWKHRQQMACIGSPADTSLEHLQKWFTVVAEVLQQIHQELQKLQDQSNKYNDASNLPELPDIERFRLSLYKDLLTNALVVEKQPIMSSLPNRPLILKTGVRFAVTVRFLANLPEFKCRLQVKPVFDKDVKEIKTIKGFRRFDFTADNSKVLDAPEGGLVAEFEHISLKEKTSKGKPKGAAESHLVVTEELHIIKFVMEFQYAGLEFNIEASSLPVVIVSSSSQIPSAWATVMWCNMLSTSEPRNLSLFVDPPPLTWLQLSQTLSWQFLSVGNRELNEDQLSMLRDKIVDDPDDLVPWQKFSKNDSAWIWIDGILDLIKKHLVDFWKDGSIMGFVGRDKTRSLLKEKPAGTFLLRFSESIKDGAITFSWVDHSNGETHVHSVEPYTKKELSVCNLADILYSYRLQTGENMTRNPLLYLYPDIHKDDAFKRYYKKKSGHFKSDYVVRRGNLSNDPTPPPSPPPEQNDVNMEIDVSAQMADCEVIQDLFPGIFDTSEEMLNRSGQFCFAQ